MAFAWWPAGTVSFAFRTWVALALAYYVAFFLQLDGASSAGVCVLILAQPAQGMVLSKALYRLAGTLVGVTSAVALVALFPQDRTLLFAAFAIWLGVLTAAATLLRDFRAYGCVLAGYTVAIVAVANVGAPAMAFSSAVNRVAAIVVGIAAIGATNAVLATAESSRSLVAKLRAATRDVLAEAAATLDEHRPMTADRCVALCARLMPLNSDVGYAAAEVSDGPVRARGARSALLGLFEMISAIQAVGTGLQHASPDSQVVVDALAIARRALAVQRPQTHLPHLDDLTTAALEHGALSLEHAFLLDRLRFMLEVAADVRDGLRSLRIGVAPRRDVTLPVHQDVVAVVLNATRVVVSVGIVSALAVWSGLPDTAQAILYTAVFVSLGSLQVNPRAMGQAALLGMPAVAVIGSVYDFLVLPNLDGFPLFILALSPLVLGFCWLVKIGQPGMGTIAGVQSIVLIAPANVQTLDPSQFVSSATMLTVSGVAIYLSFLLILPVSPAWRRLRIALSVGDALRKALADENRLRQPRASLQGDRLSQFKTWLNHADVTLARRKTMGRLVDIGALAHAVRRSWRALDACSALVGPDTDARARRLLPTLSPTETFALAREYLAAAETIKGRRALAPVHAAAALYGVAVLTTSETRLLRHVELLERTL